MIESKPGKRMSASWKSMIQCKTKPSYEESLKIKEANKNYVDGLLKNGGTSTDMFVKKIGKEKTEELFRKYVFFVGKV